MRKWDETWNYQNETLIGRSFTGITWLTGNSNIFCLIFQLFIHKLFTPLRDYQGGVGGGVFVPLGQPHSSDIQYLAIVVPLWRILNEKMRWDLELSKWNIDGQIIPWYNMADGQQQHLYLIFQLFKKYTMTSSVLLCNNLPCVIDQLNLLPSREVINLIGWWHEGNWLHNKTLLVIFYFYSNYDQTSGIFWFKKKSIVLICIIIPHVKFQQFDWSINRVTILNVIRQRLTTVKFVVEMGHSV